MAKRREDDDLEEDLKNYNPMEDDFNDQKFNRYSEGVGKDLVTSTSRGKGVRLYADGVPMALGQEGFFNLFAEYGTVVESKLMQGRDNPKTGYGFVTMETAIEAEAAIRSLHDKKLGPTAMRVKPAHTDEERKRRKKQAEMEAEFMTSLQKDSESIKKDRNEQSSKRQPSNGEMNPGHRSNQAGYGDRSHQHGQGNFQRPQFNRGPGAMGQQPNRPGMGILGPMPGLMPMGHPMMGRGGRFLGPQGFYPQMPGMIDQNYAAMNGPGGAHDQFFQGGRGRGQPIQPEAPRSNHMQTRKTCLSCGTKGSAHRCAACKMYYCSVECQTKDWSNHRVICETVREYLNENLHDSNIQSKKSPKHRDDGYETEGKGKRLDANKKQVSNENDSSSKLDSNKENKEAKNDNFQNRSTSDRNGQPARQNGASSDRIEPDQAAGDACSGVVELTIKDGSAGAFILTYYESPSKFYISLVDQIEEFTEFSNIFQELCASATGPPEKVSVGDVVAFPVFGEWNRGRVVSVRGEEVSLYFVDVGSKQTVNLQGVRPVNDDAKLYPAQALCCSLGQLKPIGTGSWTEAANTETRGWMGEPMSKFLNFSNSKKTGSTFTMSISSDQGESLNNLLVVKGMAERTDKPGVVSAVKESSQERTKPRKMVKDLNNLADGLALQTTKNCMMIDVESPSKFWVQLLEPETIQNMTKVESLLPKVETSPPYRPIVGELVAAKYSEDKAWYRAEVTAEDNDTFSLLFIDYGTRETSTEVNIRELNDLFLKGLPGLAICCSLEGSQLLSAGEELEELQAGLVTIRNEIVDIVVKQKVGCKLSVDVMIEGSSLSEMFITSIPKITEETNPQQNMPSSAAVSNSPSQREPPSISQYKSKNSGTSENTSLSKKQDSQQFSFSKQADPEKTSFSKKVEEDDDFFPTSRSPASNEGPDNKEKVRFLVEPEILPETGKVKVVVTHFENFSEFYVRLSSMDQKYEKMNVQLNKFVASKDSFPRVRSGMILAAKFGQEFYRCRVVSVNDDCALVNFMDYGNNEKVNCSDIRGIAPSFLELPSQAICCSMEEVQNCPKQTFSEFKDWMTDNTLHVEKVNDSTNNTLVNIYNEDGSSVIDRLKAKVLTDSKGGAGGAGGRGDGGQGHVGGQGGAGGHGHSGAQGPNTLSTRGSSASQSQSKVIPFNKLELNKPIRADCVAAVSPMGFIVQLASCIETAGQLTLDLTTRILATPQLMEKVAVGDCVASRFSQDQEVIWYRCRVTSIQGNTCQVFFVDYGNNEEQKLKDLMMLSDEDLKTPACTVKCCLKGCSEENVDLASVLALCELSHVSVHAQSAKTGLASVDVLDGKGTVINKFIKQQTSPQQPAAPKHSPVTQQLTVTAPSAHNSASAPLVSPASRLSALAKLSPKKPISLTQRSLPAKSQTTSVFVSYVMSASEIYVTYTDMITDLLMKLNEAGPGLPPLASPVRGTICAACWQDGMWYRARVESMTGNMCMVQFVDFGNSAQFPSSALRLLGPALLEAPAQAIRCCLKGQEAGVTDPTAVSEELTVQLSLDLTEKTVTVKVEGKVGGVDVVTMLDDQGKPLFDQVVADMAAMLPSVSDLTFVNPSEHDMIVTITHMNSFNDFYCATLANQDASNAMTVNLHNVADSKGLCDLPAPATIGTVGACIFDGVWCRCEVLKVKGAKVVLKYLDYGNTEERKMDDVKSLPIGGLTHPVTLMACALHGVTPAPGKTWDSDEIKEYQTILQTLDHNMEVHFVLDNQQGARCQGNIIVCQDGVQVVDISTDLLECGQVTRVVQAAPVNAAQAGAAAPEIQGEEEEDEDDEIQRQIAELQKKLKMKKGR